LQMALVLDSTEKEKSGTDQPPPPALAAQTH